MRRASLLGTSLAVVASIAIAGSAMAAGFTNGGFGNTGGTYVDSGSGFMGGVSGTTIPGWQITGQVDWIHTYWPAPTDTFGNTTGYSVDMNATPTAGTLTQTFDTVANSTYYIYFQYSGNPNCQSLGQYVKTFTFTYPGGSEDLTYTVPAGTTNSTMSWVNYPGASFIATGSSATVTFASTTTGSCGPALANVYVTETAATGAQCKDGGWQSMVNPDTLLAFKNQGACVSYYATSGAVPIGN